MKKRPLLALAVTVLVIVVVVVLAQQKKPGLLVLEWASKGGAEAPPTAVLIELGLKDAQSASWKGKATVSGAKVVRREGYRFRNVQNKEDKLVEPDAWDLWSHRPIRVPANQPAVAAQEGIATVGVILHLSDVKDTATLTIEPPEGKDLTKTTVTLKSVLAGEPQKIWDGQAVVRLITTTTPVNDGKTEDDFPAACYAPDGTLWVAYVGYHVRDESRRIEQKPFREQPKDFKDLYTPEFADQLFVKSLKDGKWSAPVAVTDAKQDLVRCAIAAAADGTVLVIYSANRNGRYDLYARAVHPQLGKEQSLTGNGRDDSSGYLAPVACTNQSGEIMLAAQVWYKAGYGGVFHMNKLELQENGWTSGMSGSSGGGGGAMWNVALATGPDDVWRMACDGYRMGDYDVLLPYEGTRTSSKGGGSMNPVASTSKFEARPSICYDAQGRLWIAYEEGPELWGKDYGALDDKDGEPLYTARSVRVVCLQDGKLFKPVAELPTSAAKKPHPVGPADEKPAPNFERTARYSNPQVGIDGKGRLWLTYRVKFGSRYSTHPGSYWLTYARRLDGDKWTEPVEVNQSDGYLDDHRPVLLPHAAGGLLIVHSGDGRYTTPETLQSRVWTSYLDLPGDPVEPKLVPHDPGKKDDKFVKRDDEADAAVKRIRDYRIEADGKKLRLLRGEFHRHTEISWDGGPDGSLEDMFRYAIDSARMDWIGNTDHDSGGGREYSWWLIQKFSDAYHVKDHFTPMFTYERSVAYPQGHRNCLFAKRGVRTLPRLRDPDSKEPAGIHADDTKMLYRYLKELDGICASHTSATSMGTDWRDNDPVVEPIVEIYQGDRMSYEYEEAPRAGYDPKSKKEPANIAGWYPKGFINLALGEKGYKLGFQSSSDHWSTHISYCVALAEEHSREGILAALKKRHCYGATDDIIVEYRSGDHLMGDEFKTSRKPVLQFRVIGTKPVTKVDVIRDSKVVKSYEPKQAEVKEEWTDPEPLEGVHYYYIRVTQEDGELAWASPMWIDFAP